MSGEILLSWLGHYFFLRPYIGKETISFTCSDINEFSVSRLRREDHPANPLLSDIWITQVSKTQLFVPIDISYWHVIFFNSKTLRLPALKRNLTSVIPRSVYGEVAATLRRAELGSIFSDGDRFFACVETTANRCLSTTVVVEVRQMVEFIYSPQGSLLKFYF